MGKSKKKGKRSPLPEEMELVGQGLPSGYGYQ